MKTRLLILLLSVCTISVYSQCPAGQVEVSISISTDDYGGEGYWELVPSGNACGTGTIFSGGNPNVGCNGAGNQASPPGGYASNTTITEGPWCLNQGSAYDIIYNDDWLDGGFTFTIFINGYPVYSALTGSGANIRFPFIANIPPALDIACRQLKVPAYVTYGNFYPKAWVVNRGTDTIFSFDMYYAIDNGAYQLSALSGVTIAPFDSVLATATVPYNVSSVGDYLLHLYVNNPNGSADLNPANDSSEKLFAGGPETPDIIDDYLTAAPGVTVIGNSNDLISFPTDLDFHPVLTRNELWVTLRGTANGGGATVKFSDAGTPAQTSLKQQDSNAGHFMDLPSGIAFSDNTNFATSPAIYDANHGGGSPFTGPTLWSSDSTIYCHTPPGGNGSHIDMLHQSPYSMGICSDSDNAFWVYDDNDHEIVYYDFKKDHGPGNSDHSDGIIRRYTGMTLHGDPNHMVSSHLILDKVEGMLYIADTYNDRILKMDAHSGVATNNLVPYEPVAEYTEWTNVNWSVFVASGITRPSGIDMINDRLIVSEYSTGDIVIFDMNGANGIEIGRIHTGTPGVMGVKIGPDGKIWYVNSITNQVLRLEPANVGVKENYLTNLVMYPNPAKDRLNIILGGRQSDAVLSVSDAKGSVVVKNKINAGAKSATVDLSSLAKGVYILTLSSSDEFTVKKFVKD